LQQVTAREGRPIVICEKDDVETKSLAWQTIDVPHTVDCLQVLNFSIFFHLINALSGVNISIINPFIMLI
jgi:glucosamine 6-phosphate synthetase-like amidotransferase/phosphosugar isomerase protein